MKTILTIMVALLALGSPQKNVSYSPEDMYGDYDKEGKYRSMQEQVDQINQRQEEAEKEKNITMMFILGISALVGLIPVAVIGSKIVKERRWETDKSGMWKALGIAFAGGLVLFAFNFAMLYLKNIYYDAFSKIFPIAIGLLIIVGSIVLLMRMKKKQ